MLFYIFCNILLVEVFMKIKDIFYGKKGIHIVTFITFLLFLLTILFTLSGTVYAELMNRLSFQESVLYLSELNSKNVFSLDKILMFSSASANHNEVINKALWDINVSQFTDIAIYINNHSENGLNSENIINKLYIDNIQFNEFPTLGTPSLFYKNANNFGKYEYIENNLIMNSLNFEIVRENINYEKPQLYIDTSSPICISYINSNIKSNVILSDINNALVYDGSLLKRANITLSNISTSFSFNIHVINNLNQHFICNVNIQIPLENNELDIYNGNVKKELSNLSNCQFYRIK